MDSIFDILRFIGIVIVALIALSLGGGFLFVLSGMAHHMEEQAREEEELSAYHNDAQARCEARKQLLMLGLSRPNKQLSPAEWKLYNELKQPSVELSPEEKQRIVDGFTLRRRYTGSVNDVLTQIEEERARLL